MTNRISIEELTAEEKEEIVVFKIGKEYKVRADMPHWIVSEGDRIRGMIIGRNSKSCTRCFPNTIIYKPSSEETAFAYYDFN
jgi:hypothetical protein